MLLFFHEVDDLVRYSEIFDLEKLVRCESIGFRCSVRIETYVVSLDIYFREADELVCFLLFQYQLKR